jgi:ubiquinone/menaquinone biosynthesis C-methylase UbiE
MKTLNQKQVWSNIAKEWYEFKVNSPAEHVLEFLTEKKGNILDLGSGAGRHLIKLKKGKMHLVDFSEKMIRFAKKRAKEKKIIAEFSVSDITKLPFENNFFDSAIAIAIFHCLPKKFHKKAAKELFRVLKPGAEAEIAVWNKDSKKFRNYSKKERYVAWRDKGSRYYYLFDEKEIHKLFKDAGFRIKKAFPPERNIIFVVKKPKKQKKKS